MPSSLQQHELDGPHCRYRALSGPKFSVKLVAMELTIKTPRDFNFRRTVLSHGWCALRPFELDRKSWTLVRVVDLAQAGPVTVHIASKNREINIRTARRLGKKAAAEVERDVRHMFRLDDDLGEFYQMLTDDPEFAWVAQQGRRPTVTIADGLRRSGENDLHHELFLGADRKKW